MNGTRRNTLRFRSSHRVLSKEQCRLSKQQELLLPDMVLPRPGGADAEWLLHVLMGACTV